LSYQPSSEQNVVRIWENTALSIEKLTTMQTGADAVTDTQLDLKSGHITGNVKKMSAASKYEIKLPNGVAGIRGTVYDITAEGVVRVLVGSVVVAWVNPKTGEVVTQVVMGGQQYDARSGQITAVDPSQMGSFDAMMGTIGASSSATPELFFAADQTIIPVSPVGPSANPSSTPVVH
jgi:FecR protein